MRRNRSTAPVLGSVYWLVLSILAWEIAAFVREIASENTGSWPVNPVELLLFILMPSLTAFAFVRLFLAIVQSERSLNTYSLTSSPLAWVFWLGLALALVGQGEHLAADALHRALPEVVQHGDFGAKMEFFDEQLGHWLLGGGFLLVSAVILALGPGTGPRVFGSQRTLLALGSLITYGFVIVFIGVEGQQLVPAILGSGALTAIGLRIMPPGEAGHDPVALLIMPGAGVAGLGLLIWGLVVGGQPAWPW